MALWKSSFTSCPVFSSLFSLSRICSVFSGTFLLRNYECSHFILHLFYWNSTAFESSTLLSLWWSFPHMSTHTGSSRTFCVFQRNPLKVELDSLQEAQRFPLSVPLTVLCCYSSVHLYVMFPYLDASGNSFPREYELQLSRALFYTILTSCLQSPAQLHV